MVRVLLLGKKQRYTWYIENADDVPKPDHRGVPLRRRDTSASIVDPLRRVVEHVVRDGKVEQALVDLETDLGTLTDGGLPVEKHVKTIRLGEKYANPATSIALHLDKRVTASASQSTLMVGERIEYVICKVPGAQNLAQLSVPVSELRMDGCDLQPDLEHYVVRMQKPVLDVFKHTTPQALAHAEHLFRLALAKVRYGASASVISHMLEEAKKDTPAPAPKRARSDQPPPRASFKRVVRRKTMQRSLLDML